MAARFFEIQDNPDGGGYMAAELNHNPIPPEEEVRPRDDAFHPSEEARPLEESLIQRSARWTEKGFRVVWRVWEDRDLAELWRWPTT